MMNGTATLIPAVTQKFTRPSPKRNGRKSLFLNSQRNAEYVFFSDCSLNEVVFAALNMRNNSPNADIKNEAILITANIFTGITLIRTPPTAGAKMLTPDVMSCDEEASFFNPTASLIQSRIGK